MRSASGGRSTSSSFDSSGAKPAVPNDAPTSSRLRPCFPRQREGETESSHGSPVSAGGVRRERADNVCVCVCHFAHRRDLSTCALRGNSFVRELYVYRKEGRVSTTGPVQFRFMLSPPGQISSAAWQHTRQQDVTSLQRLSCIRCLSRQTLTGEDAEGFSDLCPELNLEDLSADPQAPYLQNYPDGNARASLFFAWLLAWSAGAPGCPGHATWTRDPQNCLQ